MMIITKSAQFPFLTWLPSAMSAPTPISALVHSSTLVVSGVVLLAQYCLLSEMTFFTGIITLLLGSLMGCSSLDCKKVVAYSTLSQLGWMVLFFYQSMTSIVLIYVMAHALYKSMLFLTVSNLISQSMSQSLSKSFNWLTSSWQVMFFYSMANFFGIPLLLMVLVKEVILSLFMNTFFNSNFYLTNSSVHNTIMLYANS